MPKMSQTQFKKLLNESVDIFTEKYISEKDQSKVKKLFFGKTNDTIINYYNNDNSNDEQKKSNIEKIAEEENNNIKEYKLEYNKKIKSKIIESDKTIISDSKSKLGNSNSKISELYETPNVLKNNFFK